MRVLIIILVLIPFSLKLLSQEYRIRINPVDNELVREIPASRTAADSMQVYRVLGNILADLRGEGYLAASVDSLMFDSPDVEAWMFTGPRFEWGRLIMDSIDNRVLRKANIRPKSFSGRPVKYSKLAAAQEKILEWYENNGYPFAGIKINNLHIPGKEISGELIIETNNLFVIDTLHIKGDARISRKYIENLTGIEAGDFYRENRIGKISERIRETAFLEEIKPAELEFFDGKTDVYTYLRKSQANQFNGIIGVFPNSEQTGKLFLTGDLHLYLINSFGKGESIRFAWKSLQPLSQELDLSLSWPYVFSSMIGAGVDFSLMKQDTSWLTVNPLIDLRFFLGGNNYFHVYYDYFNSSLISTSGFENINSLPPWADVSGVLYGLGIQYRNLDYLYNPGRGWDIHASLGIGTRKIRKNPAFPDKVYDQVNMSSTKIKGSSDIGYHLPLAAKFSIYLASRTGYLYNRDLFENELFRLGGIHTLRGVDENSIFASFYSLGTIETRYRFEQNSAFFLFLDGGYYEKDLPDDFTSDFPFGFGMGMNLATRAGIFSLVYALGKQFDNPVNIGRAKIHFGYLNRF